MIARSTLCNYSILVNVNKRIYPCSIGFYHIWAKLKAQKFGFWTNGFVS